MVAPLRNVRNGGSLSRTTLCPFGCQSLLLTPSFPLRNLQDGCLLEGMHFWDWLAPADDPGMGCIMAGLPTAPWSLPCCPPCPPAERLMKLNSWDSEDTAVDDKKFEQNAGGLRSPGFGAAGAAICKGTGVMELMAAAVEPGYAAMPESQRLIDGGMKLSVELSLTVWPRVDAGSCKLVGQTVCQQVLAAAPAGILKVEASEDAAYRAAPTPVLPVKLELAGAMKDAPEDAVCAAAPAPLPPVKHALAEAKEEALVAAKVEVEEGAQAAAPEMASTGARKRKRAR